MSISVGVDNLPGGVKPATRFEQATSTPVVEVRYILIVPKDESELQNLQWQIPKGWNQKSQRNHHRGNVHCLGVPVTVCSTIIKKVYSFEHVPSYRFSECTLESCTFYCSRSRRHRSHTTHAPPRSPPTSLYVQGHLEIHQQCPLPLRFPRQRLQSSLTNPPFKMTTYHLTPPPRRHHLRHRKHHGKTWSTTRRHESGPPTPVLSGFGCVNIHSVRFQGCR